ncbi:hypothetical protein ASA1KI_14900 [Opitutales bacterium ASA1]|uniref:tetratricopeptide repeat protein n=1 Tax=Congregicoccus parvus TaxID=3081749 RepID=UPI002B2F46EA|nr:hypothetical protein ASA1KI_14900 [Opitutales bacterium ASA1]
MKSTPIPTPSFKYLRCATPAVVLTIAATMILPLWSSVAAAADQLDDFEEDESVEETAAAPSPGEALYWDALALLSSDNTEERERGREAMREAADFEYGFAQLYMGEASQRGSDGFPRNMRRAAEWFRLAAERGNSPAKAYLGICYGRGLGVRRDPDRATHWLNAALADAASFRPPVPPATFFETMAARHRARAGEADGPIASSTAPSAWESLCATAHLVLGEIHEKMRKPADALRHYESSAYWGEEHRAGLALASRKAATAYALGQGTTRDLTKANALLEHARGLTKRTGISVFHSLWTRRALDDFFLAESEKFVELYADLEFLREQQKVTDALLAVDPKEAVRWCELAAESGEVWAMIKLAEFHHAGVLGRRDPEQVFAWYKRAAEEHDHYLAWGNLVVCHRDGIGTPVDVDKAQEIAAARRKDNFVCALAGEGLSPKKGLGVDDWSDLLDAHGRRGKPAIARYHRAMTYVRLGNAMLGGQASFLAGTFYAEALPLLERAAKDEVGPACHELGRMYHYGYGVKRDAAKAREYYRKGIALGDSASANGLGLIVMEGIGEDRPRPDVAIAHFEKAVELDPKSVSALNNLGLAYDRAIASTNIGSEKSSFRANAIKYYELAEALGGDVAAYNLGRIYYGGAPNERDFRKAYMYFQTAAERGHTVSNRMLGNMHMSGEGVPVTPKDALFHYRLAALDGDLQALRRVCDFYLGAHDLALDLDQAAFWTARLAQQGDVGGVVTWGQLLAARKRYKEARAFWNQMKDSSNSLAAGFAHEGLAGLYRHGLGVKANPARAQKHQERAYALGAPGALCQEGRRLIVEKRASEALPILEKAVGSGSIEAVYLLGTMYIAGNGVERDTTKAWTMLRKAADSGYNEARVNVAISSLQGREGAPDLETALRYAEAAERDGHPRAKEVRERLEAKRKEAQTETDVGRPRSA